ncbi:MAG: energy-coupling factor transporter transmembrane protein EcfT [Atopobiaceae bacterium]|nr:energy-coupling factor transporter transmembrane protein EcfT [Atopobiaceae bacterium]
MGPDTLTDLPSWLAAPQSYEPLHDRGGFIAKSMLSITSVLAQLRLDDGHAGSLSPSAPVKVILALGAIIVNALARNLMVTFILLAFVLVRAALLPRRALARTASVAGAAAAIAFVLALPAVLLGQPASAVRLGLKALVSTGLAMEVALATPAGELTGALRVLHVPNLVIMTIDLALRNIARLGEAALETLTALQLRSVGRDADKRASMGNVGGTLFVRAAKAADDTYDAMRCRCFEGEYDGGTRTPRRAADAVWIAAFVLLVILALHLEGVY